MTEPVIEAQPQPPPEPLLPEPAEPRKPKGARRGGATGVNGQGKGESPASAGTPDVAKQIANATRASAVRGDRSATGGPKRLTEEELSAKLQAMQLKNESLLAAHARAEADLASFEAREAEAARKQVVDRQNRQQMMGERERNRQRKLKAVGGREWDAEKKEEDFAESRRVARRGAHGGVVGGHPASAAPEDGGAEDGSRSYASRGRGQGRGRGREGRGGRGGRDVSRGGEKSVKEKQQAPPTASDFPDLPATSKDTEPEVNPPTKLEFPIKPANDAEKVAIIDKSKANATNDTDILTTLSPAGEKKSWADQVEGTLSP
ncbi:hypothetical protein P152DRAFT_147914 [Eremomyces bilateralis CBS 781.70]|uniref:Uncharacterized protein n=1 Tax=Eremomyces bilateralis CBS 781.70 TaxID=1392243 RepID=A0A6G1FVL0_9PEZI|nr:uncharacterized protein P152DRAFT_147914 [Eremomyces bilateralis CBS 781.70]KAF1809750.1 hypothetical protein P152DRAFT_147914 [Eremomyces bilateralis CBS 781.70]